MGQSMRRAMIALGLAEPDAETEQRELDDRHAERRQAERSPRDEPDRRRPQQQAAQRPAPQSGSASAGSPATRPAAAARRDPAEQGARAKGTHEPRRDAEYRAPVTPIKRAPSTSREDAEDMRTITTVHPRSYNDAKAVGESFRDGTPVIMDLTDLGEAEAKRLVDFAAGLVYALHGSIERVTTTVFLLTPSYVEVIDTSTDETEIPEAAEG